MKSLGRLSIFVALVLVFGLNAKAFGAASISGTIKFTGEAPALKPIDMNADPVCKSANAKPVLPEILVLGSGNTMANVFVRVKGGLPSGKSYPAPAQPAVIDQKGCQYHPHVLGVMVGQNLKITNSDPTLHNVHAMPKVNTEFNMAMPKTKKESDKTFRKAESFFPMKCDVHPWMNSWIAVMEHPFFSVTKSDGKFAISGLDPGNYEIEAWHEKLGTQTMKVTVAANETKSVDFNFSKPAGK